MKFELSEIFVQSAYIVSILQSRSAVIGRSRTNNTHHSANWNLHSYMHIMYTDADDVNTMTLPEQQNVNNSEYDLF